MFKVCGTKIEDTALIWMLTSAKKNKKQNVPVNAKRLS